MVKVTEVKSFLVHSRTGENLLFVNVVTDSGIQGWGELQA